jgi:hypothetical protein
MATKNDWRNSPTAWFSVLERALRDGDSELVAQATEELRRLGVNVSISHDRLARALEASR